MNASDREAPQGAAGGLRIAHVIGISPAGGSAATARRQMLGMSARGHRVVCVTAPGLDWVGALAGSGVELRESLALRRGFRPLSFLADVLRLKGIIRAGRPDVLHLHKATEYLTGALAAWLAGGVAVVRSRGVVVPVRGHVFNRWLHNSLTDRVVVTASAIKRSYERLRGFDPAKVVLIHDGIDPAAFDAMPKAAEARRRFALPEGVPVVGSVARAAAVKGHRHLIEAFRSVLKAHPSAVLFIATYAHHAQELARLRELVASSGLGGAVVMHDGYLDDMHAAYAAMDVYVLASVGSEGSSRATLEAMAASRPVVATRVGVLPDLVAEGGTGLLVEPGNAAALAGAISGLLADPSRRRGMGEAGRRRLVERFSEKDSLDRLEGLYRELTAERRRGR